MKRLRRNIFNGLLILSVLLSLGAAVAFIFSDFLGDQPWRWSSGRFGMAYRTLTIAKTQIRVEHYTPVGTSKPGSTAVRTSSFSGFEFDTRGILVSKSMAPGAPVCKYEGYQITIPSWPIFLGLIGLLFYRARILFRHARIPGKCSVCGYDLRATPKRCPECGAVPMERT